MKTAYELVLLLPADRDKNKEKKLLDDISLIIEKTKGKVVETTNWGKKSLAYPIKKKKEANFCLLTFETEGKEVVSIVNKLKHNEDVLRYLIIKKE